MSENEQPNTTHFDAAEPAAGGTSYEAVWTFRGYKMRPSEFNTAMVHYLSLIHI